ncbi:uncharacterized protein LOC141634514 [Silene latifolia]|uniref:uncharacterized protein LOC141634514 n=1 Tax=Silene latifolia TaxID=37657 RepID=UPI003D784217
MVRLLKTPKMNHGGNSTTMEDLDDYMLTQILLRLPNCETVLVCSAVNKRWCSLISDPNFQVHFADHKNKTTAFLNDVPQWSLIATIKIVVATMKSWEQPFITEFLFGSPKLSLEFLPGNSIKTMATFKDLVLCSSKTTDQSGRRVYYITNPLTKQWVALPPRPYQWPRIQSTALICQPPYNHTQDYKFRVVEVLDPHMDTFDLFVYCSEIGEWKEIKLRVPSEEFRQLDTTVVCNGIIYFKSGLSLVGLDPFDVDDTCDTTLEARVMPPLPNFGHLQESSGQILVVHTPGRQQGIPCLYKKDGSAIELEMVVSKLDPNQVPLVWETTFQGQCKGTWNSIELPYITKLGYIYATNIWVQPYNDKLIYIYLAHENQLVLCNTGTGGITPSKSLPHNKKLIFHSLEQQWWPTLVPSLVQRVTLEQNMHVATTTVEV